MITNHEGLATFFVATVMPLFLFTVDLDLWVKVALGTGSLIWILWQLYMSFRSAKYIKAREVRTIEKRAEEKAKAQKEQELLDLQIRKAKRDLGEEDSKGGRNAEDDFELGVK